MKISNVLGSSAFLVTAYHLEGIVIIRCFYGFEIQPGMASAAVRCSKGGVWNPDPLSNFTCSLVSCSIPPNISNAITNFNGTVFHDTVSSVTHGAFWFYLLVSCHVSLPFIQLL